MHLKKQLAAFVVLAVFFALAPAAAQANDRPAFRKYVACGKMVEAKPSRSCRRASEKGAFFRSNRRNVFYAVCVTFPTRKALCAKKQRAKKGELYVNEITSKMRGIHRVTWFVRGKKVGTFRFRITR